MGAHGPVVAAPVGSRQGARQMRGTPWMSGLANRSTRPTACAIFSLMRYRRVTVEGATYFFAVVTEKRRPLFADPANVALSRRRSKRSAFVIPSRSSLRSSSPTTFTRGLHTDVRGAMRASSGYRGAPETGRASRLATSVLGAHHSRRRGSLGASRLHPHQPRPPWPRHRRARLAAFLIPPVGRARDVRDDVGLRRQAPAARLGQAM